jgi:hypothetical protein
MLVGVFMAGTTPTCKKRDYAARKIKHYSLGIQNAGDYNPQL